MGAGIACTCLSLVFLSNGCAIASRMGIQPPDRAGGPRAGEEAPDFELISLDEERWKLSETLRHKPVALILGSYSCPAFRGWLSALQELAETHGDEVQFLILYTVEAHPAGSSSPYREKEWLTSFNIREDIRLAQPESAAERHALARTCRDALGLNIPMLPDTMEKITIPLK